MQCFVTAPNIATTADIIKAVQGKPYSVKNELRRLVDACIIKKVRHGVYSVLTDP